MVVTDMRDIAIPTPTISEPILERPMDYSKRDKHTSFRVNILDALQLGFKKRGFTFEGFQIQPSMNAIIYEVLTPYAFDKMAERARINAGLQPPPSFKQEQDALIHEEFFVRDPIATHLKSMLNEMNGNLVFSDQDCTAIADEILEAAKLELDRISPPKDRSQTRWSNFDSGYRPPSDIPPCDVMQL